jgi:hypothetical protein
MIVSLECVSVIVSSGGLNDLARNKNKLKLRPIPYLSSQGSLADLPTGYLWSPQLVPKPDGMLQARFSK